MYCGNCGKFTENADCLCDECRAAENANAQEQPIVLNTQGAPAKTSSKKWVIIGAAVAAVAILLGCLFAFGVFNGDKEETVVIDIPSADEVESMVFDNAKDQFLYLEQYSIESMFAYANTAATNKGLELHVKLGDTIKNALAQQVGMPLDWLSDIMLTVEAASKNDITAMEIGFGIGNKQAATLRYVIEAFGQKMYIGVPEASDKYILMDYQKLMLEEGVGASTSVLSNIDISKLFTNADAYIDIFINSIENVTSEPTTITVNGVSQNVTKLTVKYTAEQLANTMVTLLQQVKNDQALRSVLEAYILASLPEYENFDAFIDEGIETFRNIISEDPTLAEGYILWVDYVDDKNHIVGREFCNGDGESFYYLTATDGGSFATEASLAELQITGSGTENKGKITGEYSLTIDSQQMLTASLEDFYCDISRGICSGDINITLSEAVTAAVMSEITGMGTGVSVNLDMSLDITANKVDATADLYVAGVYMAGLSASTYDSDIKVSVPEKTIESTFSEEGMIEWISGFDLSKIIDNLEKGGIPSDIAGALRTFAAMLPMYINSMI